MVFIQIPAWINQDTITTFIAVLSFIITVAQLISQIMKNRECFKIEPIDYVVHPVGDRTVVQFLICISNLSHHPLTVITIDYDGVCCELEPKPIKGNPGFSDYHESPQFPLCISGYSAQYFYLEFVIRPVKQISLSPGTTVTFEICTTGSVTIKNVLLGDKSRYLPNR